MNAHKKQFTWRRRYPDIKCRLDYFLICSCIMNKTKQLQVKITAGFRTDHSLVTIDILSENMYPGWLPLLGGQSVPEGSRNPVVCV